MNEYKLLFKKNMHVWVKKEYVKIYFDNQLNTKIWLHSKVHLKLSCFPQHQDIPESNFIPKIWSVPE